MLLKGRRISWRILLLLLLIFEGSDGDAGSHGFFINNLSDFLMTHGHIFAAFHGRFFFIVNFSSAIVDSILFFHNLLIFPNDFFLIELVEVAHKMADFFFCLLLFEIEFARYFSGKLGDIVDKESVLYLLVL